MPSISPDSEPSSSHPEKRQRITRACDTCRRRKVKCDQDAVSGAPCQRCLDACIACTWDDEVKKRGRKRRVEELEARLRVLEAALSQQAVAVTRNAADPLPPPSTGPTSAVESSDDEDDPNMKPLIERVSRLEIGAMESGVFQFFISTSAGNRVTRTVDRLRADVGLEHPPSGPSPDPWEVEESVKWRMAQRHSNFLFPPADLLPALVDAYILHHNVHVPLLHVPTFRDDVAKQLHCFDRNFAVVLLLVCAIGARFVDDPRVYLPGQPERSAGWGWYSQCEITRLNLLSPPTLFQIQAYILATSYLGGMFNAHVTWLLPIIALRCMQEMGVDRKRVYSMKPNTEDEKWKRCFWIAAMIDVSVASEVGRPCFLVDGSFDVDLPIACDDEFWSPEDSAKAFQQPAGRPSMLAAFVHFCRLKLIHMKAMRTLFSVQAESQPRQEALCEIKSTLSEWLENTPSHVDWSLIQHTVSTDSDELEFIAARLRLDYHYILLIIHRPFISLRRSTPESLNSFAACTTAARAICGVFRESGIANKRETFSITTFQLYANGACLVLFLTIWGAREMNMQVDTEGISSDIELCLDVLKARAPFYRQAETMHQRLAHLASRAKTSHPANRSPPKHAVNGDEKTPLSPPNIHTDDIAMPRPKIFPFPLDQFAPTTSFPQNAYPLEELSAGQSTDVDVPDDALLYEDSFHDWTHFTVQRPSGMLASPQVPPDTSDFGSDLLWEWSQAGHFMGPAFDSRGNF